MSYELYLRLYDRSGVQKIGFIAPLFARFTDAVNGDDPLVFGLNLDHEAVSEISEFDLVEVMIRNQELLLMAPDKKFVSAFVGIVRNWDLSTNDDGESFLEYMAPGINHILSWRAVLWYAGVSDRSQFDDVAAETIMKTLVNYNCTVNASTANGRQRNGNLSPGMGIDLSIEADGGGGNLLSATFKGGNLLSSLQKLADQAAGDFALIWNGSNDFEFQFYAGQLGDDKSSGAERVLFSLANNTMRNPRIKRSGAAGTVAISAGAGKGVLREISEVFGSDYAADYDLEIFVDARQEVTDEGRVYRGGLKLDEKRIREELTFNVIQTGNQFYSPISITGRKTFKAGDLVLCVYGTEEIRKIESVKVYWNSPSSDDAFNVDVITREVVSYGS